MSHVYFKSRDTITRMKDLLMSILLCDECQGSVLSVATRARYPSHMATLEDVGLPGQRDAAALRMQTCFQKAV
jgi:hypothetical protein